MEREGAGAGVTPPERLDYLDNLKALLLFLVLLAHALHPYRPGAWWYVAVGGRAWWAEAVFTGVCMPTMGVYLACAGYFLPASYDRRGARRFLLDRLVRLGVPCLVFALLVVPLLSYLGRHRGVGDDPGFLTYLLRVHVSRYGLSVGHLWFVGDLLLFSLLYAAYRHHGRRPVAGDPGRERGDLPDRSILAFALALGAITALVRVRYPFDGYRLLLGVLPTDVGRLPQYVAFAAAGLVARRNGWLARLSTRTGRRFLAVWLACICVRLVPSPEVQRFFSGSRARSGLTWECAAVSFWEALLCTGFAVGLVVLFRERVTIRSPFSTLLARQNFAVFVVHVPIVVLLHAAVTRAAIPIGLAWSVVLVAGTVTSLLAARALTGIPGVNRVL